MIIERQIKLNFQISLNFLLSVEKKIRLANLHLFKYRDCHIE